jgi:hypothetical protein
VAAVLAEDRRRWWNIDHDWDSSSDYENLEYESSEDGEREYIIQDDEPNFDGALNEFGEYAETVYQQVRADGVGRDVNVPSFTPD